MEYDVEINPTKLIKGLTLYENMIAFSHMIAIIKDEELTNQESDWIKQFGFYFRTGKCHESLDKSQRRRFKLQALRYKMIDYRLYINFFDETLLKYVTQE